MYECPYWDLNLTSSVLFCCLPVYYLNHQLKNLWNDICTSFHFTDVIYYGDTHIAALLLLSVHQAIHRPSQQQLNRHSKPLFHSLLLCLLSQTKKTTPDKKNYLLETTPISSANQPMTEQADQQWPV